MIANWVQTEALSSGELSNQTDEILKNKDVQEQLSIFAVDQLYANVNVQAQIQQKLPSAAQPLAAPVTAATQQLATNVAQTALASPQVQALVSTAVGRAQQQFVDLIENKDQFVSTQGGVVTVEYGSFVADLATRLGVYPATISQIQGLIQQYSTELKQRLTTAQTRIESARATLSQAQAGTLSPQTQQNLQTLQTDAAQLQATVRSLEQKIKGILPKAPAQLQSKVSDVQGRLAQLDKRLTGLLQRVAAVLKDPRQANIIKLSPRSPPSRHASPRCSTVRRFTPGRARRDEVQPAERAPGPRERAAQPRLRAAAADALAVPGRDLPGEGMAPRGANGSRRRDPGGNVAHPAGEAPARQCGHRFGGELRRGQAGHQRRLEHLLRGAATAGAVRTRDRPGVHRRGLLQGPAATRSPCDASSRRTYATARLSSMRLWPLSSWSGCRSSRRSTISVRSSWSSFSLRSPWWASRSCAGRRRGSSRLTPSELPAILQLVPPASKPGRAHSNYLVGNCRLPDEQDRPRPASASQQPCRS